jgi:hypothetical protein
MRIRINKNKSMDPERNVLVCYMIMDASDVMKKALLATITDPFERLNEK